MRMVRVSSISEVAKGSPLGTPLPVPWCFVPLTWLIIKQHSETKTKINMKIAIICALIALSFAADST